MDCQEVARWDREWQASFLSESAWERIDQIGYLPGTWHREVPAKRAILCRQPDGRGDVPAGIWDTWQQKDPEGYAAFVDEFGRRGAAVGQTYRVTGLTLGDQS